jgi:hypothetical protein
VALASATLASLILPLSQGRQQGWPPWTWVMIAAVALLLWAFLRSEDRLARHGGMPLIDLELLSVRSRRGTPVAPLFFFTMPFYLLFAIERQDVGLDPLQTGLAILPYGTGFCIGPVVSVPLLRRREGRLPNWGLTIEVNGNALTAVAVIGRLPLIATVLLAGFGQGVAMPRLFTAALAAARDGGLAAGVVSSALRIGAAISVAGSECCFSPSSAADPGRQPVRTPLVSR